MEEHCLVEGGEELDECSSNDDGDVVPDYDLRNGVDVQACVCGDVGAV